MYEVVADPYCYAGSAVLKNIPGLRDAAALDQFETVVAAQRSDEPLPFGRLSVTHYRSIHRHLFQDVNRWAGQFRRVRISKGDSVFCYPEHIPKQMTALFADLRGRQFLRGLAADGFAAGAAQFLTTLNAIHPFRDGNGRTQLAFLTSVGSRAGHSLALKRLDHETLMGAMVRSFRGDEGPLVKQLRSVMN